VKRKVARSALLCSQVREDRDPGKRRLEGREYIMRDCDMVHIRFKV
jgi:hypothetical protein